jgi:hypothetical protein
MEEKNVLNEIPQSESKPVVTKIPTISENMNRDTSDKENDVNVLSGDNKVDVDIEPDVKSNDVYLQLCSCSLVFNCLTKDSTAKNSD